MWVCIGFRSNLTCIGKAQRQAADPPRKNDIPRADFKRARVVFHGTLQLVRYQRSNYSKRAH